VRTVDRRRVERRAVGGEVEEGWCELHGCVGGGGKGREEALFSEADGYRGREEGRRRMAVEVGIAG
jgi:ribosomal protein S6E (S10)